jgi:hypothetical protein
MVVKSTEPVTYEGERGELLERIYERIDTVISERLGSRQYTITLNDFLPIDKAKDHTSRQFLIAEYDWLFEKIVEDYTQIGHWKCALIFCTDEESFTYHKPPFNIWLFLSDKDTYEHVHPESQIDRENEKTGFYGSQVAYAFYETPKLSKSEKRKKSKAEGSAEDSSYISLPRIVILAGVVIFLTIYFSGIETFLIGVAGAIITFLVFLLSLKSDSEET